MKREIKFRAFDKFNDCYYTSDKSGTLSNFFEGVDRAIQGGNNVILEQFTGLKDRSGTEIYEGDCFSYGQSNRYASTIEFEKGCFGYMYFGDFITIDALKPEKITIIGNIHQNPDLLSPSPSEGEKEKGE